MILKRNKNMSNSTLLLITWVSMFVFGFVYYLCNRSEIHPVKRKKKYPKA